MSYQDIDPALLPEGFHQEAAGDLDLPFSADGNALNYAQVRQLFSDDEGGDSEEEQMGSAKTQMGAIQSQLQSAAPFGGRRAKRPNQRKMLAPDTLPTFEVAGLLGQANRLYAEGEYGEALNLLKEIIRIEHNTFDAWSLLAEINGLRGNLFNKETALSIAATLRPREGKLWLELISLRKELGAAFEDIDSCYTRAIKAFPKDMALLQERAQFCVEARRTRKAIEYYKQALARAPHEIMLIQELATALHHEDRFDEAVSVLEAAAQYAMQQDERELFSWPQLNMLSEAYVTASEEKPSAILQEWIAHIKRVARWLRDRQDQTFWEEREDDAEFEPDNERRFAEALHDKAGEEADPSAYKVPLEIQIRLGQLRLATGKDGYDEAIRHFEAFDLDKLDTYWDFYLEAAKSLLAQELWEEAAGFFSELVDRGYADQSTCFAYAQALNALGDYERAQEMLEFIIEKDPEDSDAMVLLARVHELSGDRQKALDLINAVIDLRRAEESQWQTQQREQEDLAMQQPQVSGPSGETHWQQQQQKRSTARTPSKRKRVATAGAKTAATKHEDQVAYETRKLEETSECLIQLDLTRDAMLTGQPEAVDGWMKAASNLVDDFRTVAHFFPSRRKMPGLDLSDQIIRGRGRQKAIQTAEERLQNLRHRLHEGIQVERHVPASGTQQGAERETHFRRVPFETWLAIWMQYALLLVQCDAAEEAWTLLLMAEVATPFSTRPQLVEQLIKFQLFLACQQGDAHHATRAARNLILRSGLRVDPIRLYAAACYGNEGLTLFHATSGQKFFLRLIKAMDRSLGREVEQSGVKELEHAPLKDVAHLLAWYGEKLNAGRQHVYAIHYLTRALSVAPDDPRLNLDLGIAFLERAMQRQVDNRHLSVVKALSFFQKYYTAREASKDLCALQEAEYNLGRAYHGVCLYHLAIPRYRQVLAMSDAGFPFKEKHDLAMDAAYNLILIMVLSGNAQAAEQLTERYLTI